MEELQSVLNMDALITSHPISVEVNDPDEINEIFDGISYSKGTCAMQSRNRPKMYYRYLIALLKSERNFFSLSRRVNNKNDGSLPHQ